MYGFHSSGEYCCDRPLCYSQVKASVQAATASIADTLACMRKLQADCISNDLNLSSGVQA